LPTSILVLKNISKSFKVKSFYQNKIKISKIQSLDDISLSVENGKMIGIIGKNGSGKTTLLRIIAGIFQPDSGTLEVDGTIGPLLQIGAGANDEYSVQETIIFSGLLHGFSIDEITKKIPEILKFAELESYANAKMKYLSSGMKIRILFSVSLTIDPDILLVDEVMAVGDIVFREKSFKSFLNFKKEGKTIILVSHNLSLIQQLCDEVYLLDKGKVIEHGTPKRVIERYRELIK